MYSLGTAYKMAATIFLVMLRQTLKIEEKIILTIRAY